MLAVDPSLARDSDEVALEKRIDVTKTKHDNEASIDVSKIKKFNLAYGFYVVMGGLVVDI